MTVTVELRGLELHGHHGVEEEERRRGQRFLFDVWLETRDAAAAASDRIEDAVDYREVVAALREVAPAPADVARPSDVTQLVDALALGVDAATGLPLLEPFV